MPGAMTEVFRARAFLQLSAAGAWTAYLRHDSRYPVMS
jgi:hypothetical protein